MENDSNNPYSSPEEMAAKLGLTLQEAESIMKSWGYKKPTDPEKLLVHARKGSRYEHYMRGLNTDRREGRITEAEYQQLANEFDEKTQPQ